MYQLTLNFSVLFISLIYAYYSSFKKKIPWLVLKSVFVLPSSWHSSIEARQNCKILLLEMLCKEYNFLVIGDFYWPITLFKWLLTCILFRLLKLYDLYRSYDQKYVLMVI